MVPWPNTVGILGVHTCIPVSGSLCHTDEENDEEEEEEEEEATYDEHEEERVWEFCTRSCDRAGFELVPLTEADDSLWPKAQFPSGR